MHETLLGKISLENQTPTLIAGPCAVESAEQMETTSQIMIASGVDIIRTTLVKPRTKSGGFEGVGVEDGLPIMIAMAQKGLIPATEIMKSEQAGEIVDSFGKQGSLPIMLWIGARNQRHDTVREIASIANYYGNSLLMLKMYRTGNEGDIKGMVDHVLSTGFPKELLSLCFAGFDPTMRENPYEDRNLFRGKYAEHALQIGQDTQLPVLFDPSHSTGRSDRVINASIEALQMGFSGLFVEVHPNPTTASTDQGQQLNPNQFEKLLNEIAHQQDLIKTPYEELIRT